MDASDSFERAHLILTIIDLLQRDLSILRQTVLRGLAQHECLLQCIVSKNGDRQTTADHTGFCGGAIADALEALLFEYIANARSR